jgi:GDP/UDP-N,N'-diacetylbacillosamine 2-epimerase (hydrolysing)
VAADEYRRRVIQMGEDPKRVFDVGGLGVEAVRRTPLMNREEVQRALGIQLSSPSFLVTYHPVTLEAGRAVEQLREILQAFADAKDAQFIFTESNADPEGNSIRKMVQNFCSTTPTAHYFQSMGQHLYLSTMAQVDAVVGNSSSGLLEAPAMGVGTVNIGGRQDRRLRASSVIDCDCDAVSVAEAISRVRSEAFLSGLSRVENPYGSGETSKTIVGILERQNFLGLLRKVFNDLSNQKP